MPAYTYSPRDSLPAHLHSLIGQVLHRLGMHHQLILIVSETDGWPRLLGLAHVAQSGRDVAAEPPTHIGLLNLCRVGGRWPQQQRQQQWQLVKVAAPRAAAAGAAAGALAACKGHTQPLYAHPHPNNDPFSACPMYSLSRPPLPRVLLQPSADLCPSHRPAPTLPDILLHSPCLP